VKNNVTKTESGAVLKLYGVRMKSSLHLLRGARKKESIHGVEVGAQYLRARRVDRGLNKKTTLLPTEYSGNRELN